MNKEKEEMLEKLRNVKQTAESYLAENNFENYVVKNVVRYNKEVELIKKDSENKDVKKFHLYVVELENTDPEIEENNILTELEYLEDEDGNLYTISDLIKEYEGFENIKDVVDKTKENEEKPKEEQYEEFKKDSLEELEEEKSKEEKEEKDKEEKDKEENVNRKPKYIIQTIDTDAYSDNIETIHRAFRLPPNVKQLAFAYANKEDKSQLGSGATIYMLDSNGNIVGDAKQYFRVDDATGKNPMDDNNTELELDETGERHEGKTMRRFRSTKRPDQYLSLKQKEVGQYNEVYADRKEETENSSIGIQVETRNVGIQTSLEMQQINSTYKGVYNPDEIDKEVDEHEKHGDDIDKVKKENVDGNESTKVACEKNIYLLYECLVELKERNEYINKNFSDENIIKVLIFNIDKNPKISKEDLLNEVEENFKNTKDLEESQNEIEEEYEGRVPWDSTKH